MESSDSGEEVYESEGMGHYVKLSPPCHFLWEPSSSEWHAFLIQRGVIFGLHMSDKKSGEKLASLLVSYLAAHPGSSARQVAVALGVEKSRVNAILYGRKSVFVPEGGSPPQWSVAFVEQASGSESRATPSSVNLEEPVVSQSEALSNVGMSTEMEAGIILAVEDSSKAEAALAKAEEYHSAGLLREAVEQYQLASRLFLGRGRLTAEATCGEESVRVNGQSKTSRAAGNGSSEGEPRVERFLGGSQGAPAYRSTALAKEVEELVWQFPGISYSELALLIGSSEVEVRSAAKRVRYLIFDDSESDDVDEPSVNERNDELLGAIRTAGTMEFPLSSDGYDDLLRRGFIKGVTSVRIGQIFGSWRRACEIAGVEAPKAARSSYESRWTDHELAEAVARFLSASEYRGAHHRYDEWRRDTGCDDDTPSSGTLLNRLGPGWKRVRRRGLDILRERWLIAEERWLVDGEAERGFE